MHCSDRIVRKNINIISIFCREKWQLSKVAWSLSYGMIEETPESKLLAVDPSASFILYVSSYCSPFLHFSFPHSQIFLSDKSGKKILEENLLILPRKEPVYLCLQSYILATIHTPKEDQLLNLGIWPCFNYPSILLLKFFPYPLFFFFFFFLDCSCFHSNMS